MAYRGARGRGAAEPGQPGPGPADGLGPDRGRRAARRVPGRGLDDRAPRRPPPAAPVSSSARTALSASRPRGDGRPRCRLPGTKPRTARTRRSSPPRGGLPPSTRAGTGSRSPAARSAPASACPTRPPPSCCASSARARACRREPPAPPDLRLPPRTRPSLVRGGQAGGRGRGAGGGSTGTAKAWQPTGTGSPARAGSRPSPAARSADCPLPARRASGPVPGIVARDGQQN